MAETEIKLLDHLDRVIKESEKKGVTINFNKTESMFIIPRCNLQIRKFRSVKIWKMF